MRDALGQPLENISQYLLNKVVSKEVKNNLKKYKSAVGKTPHKTPGKTPGRDRGRSAEKYSPAKRLTFDASPDKDDGGASGAAPAVSREIRDLIKQLNAGISDRDSLLKMLLIKCSDADQSYKQAKAEINRGNSNDVER